MPSFKPLLGANPHTLVLGSMPGQISLDQQQYYAHPRNVFWWVMSKILGFAETLPYSDRVTQLTNSQIAVWDVLYDCVRPGSLDSKIEQQSEQANDFAPFFAANPSIELIAFNGRAAEKIFMRHCADLFSRMPDLKSVSLPSTSPAYAAMCKTKKLRIWQNALT